MKNNTNNYNSERSNRKRSFNSRPVFTETSKDITPDERQEAFENLQKLIAKTKEELNEN